MGTNHALIVTFQKRGRTGGRRRRGGGGRMRETAGGLTLFPLKRRCGIHLRGRGSRRLQQLGVGGGGGGVGGST